MEDPIRFDLWCECKRADRYEIASYLRRLPLRPVPAGPDCKRLMGQRMRLQFLARSWRVVEVLRANPARWLVRLAVYQQGYGPGNAAGLHYCEVHDLHYAGVLGCHVCTGFYEGNPALVPESDSR
jgi:hypothetical protein